MPELQDCGERVLPLPDENVSLSLLLVEDDPTTSIVMVKLLERLGFQVQSAGCIAEALRIIDGAPVDVVLSDIGLPDGTGYELMAEVRKRCGAVGIALSGYDDPADIDRSHDAGFANHLVKPIDFSKLNSILSGVRAL